MVLTLHFVGSALQGQLEELLCNPQTFPSGSWDVISVISTFWGSWGRGSFSAVSLTRNALCSPFMAPVLPGRHDASFICGLSVRDNEILKEE